MRLLRPTTLRLVPILIASACGGRSAIDDTVGFFPLDDEDLGSGGRSSSGGSLVSTGGRPNQFTGGTGNGGAFPIGGAFPVGGASPVGGGFTTGGTSPCPDGTWGDGVNCEEWRTCEPGEYISYWGNGTTNRLCYRCPRDTFSEATNQVSCEYAGCAFSELVVTPGDPTRAAVCAGDTSYVNFGPYNPLLGLSHRGPRAYAALQGYGEIILRGYEMDTLVDEQIIELEQDEGVQAFALAPDGTTYLQGTLQSSSYPYDVSRWLGNYASDSSILWKETLTASQGTDNAGVLATDSHWMSWGYSYAQTATELTLWSSPHSTFAPDPPSTGPAFGLIQSIAADDQERVWLTADLTGTMVVGYLDAASPFEPVALSGSFNPLLVTVEPGGTAYVLGADPLLSSSFQIFALDSSGAIQDAWSLSGEAGLILSPTAIGVDPGRAVYASFHSWDDGSFDYPRSRTNVLMMKIDLTTDEITTKVLMGPNDDLASKMTVTSDGSVYIAGSSEGNTSEYFLREVSW